MEEEEDFNVTSRTEQGKLAVYLPSSYMAGTTGSALLASMTTQLSLESRIYGCWLGKSIGGTLGLPAEGRTERLSYSFYDPIPTIAPPNDDLELQLVWLHLLETRGFDLSQDDLARAWLDHIHYMWDEYGRTRWNLRRNVPPSDAGTFENPFVSGMGSPIRSEIWACVAGGDAQIAARYGELDASLDHGIEGIEGEIYFCVLQTLVLGGATISEALMQARDYISGQSETARALDLVFREHQKGTEAWATREALLREHNSENFTHAPLNVALTVWALLYGEGDFDKSILLGVNCGYDTDCTAATVGATLGLALGREGIPARWSAPIGEGVFIGEGILNANPPTTLGDLTQRTLVLMEKLKAHGAPRLAFHPPTNSVEVATLPGTIELVPLGQSAPVKWSNGELPIEAKSAGGATWRWNGGEFAGKSMNLLALADAGAKLFLDEELIVDCPPGLPYVPAPHRTPHGSQVQFAPQNPQMEVRIALASTDPKQRASVILSQSNFHLAPWTGEMLPFEPQLD